MSIQLTMCRLCTHSRPEFRRAVDRLLTTFPNELRLEELECMAACDDVPAVMIETDYYPQVTAADLDQVVRRFIAAACRQAA